MLSKTAGRLRGSGRGHLHRALVPLGACVAAALVPLQGAEAGVTFRLDRLQAGPGETVRVEAMFFNEGNATATWDAPQELILQWRDAQGNVVRTPARLDGGRAVLQVPVGQFSRASWSVTVPAQARGLQAIAIEGEPVLLALDATSAERGEIVAAPAVGPIVDPAAPGGARVPDAGVLAGTGDLVDDGAARSTAQQGPPPAASDDRSVLDRFRSALSPYEPVYFSLGARPHLNARFQISLKFRLFQPDDERESGFLNNLYLGYTQTSLWDIGENSAPFRDSSYRPSVFWLSERVWESPDRRKSLGFDGGFEHESNGRGDDDSRAINSLYARPTLRYRFEDGSTLSFGPKIKYYVTRKGNPDIADYRGHVDYQLRWARDDGLMVSALARKGHEKGSLQVDMAYPLRKLGLGKLNGFLHVQYFNGYGETLLDYNVRAKSQVRIGLMVVR
ncbi:phospholipase A [Pigmentiphaga sp.]|uniref:phospholipase A n=1 Tax=Pigmentiphaga sp. TaxID=1977564 RepID=UPI0025FB892C|nr:phospholipase A [Pigmentiphaga sp.]MBX6319574.1 phospholipase A [Pigmentiphaga sp.]